MLPEEIRLRQRTLIHYLDELAKVPIKEENIENWINKFDGIYEDNFRHNYSDFFPLLQQFYDNGAEGNVDYLTNNIELIRSRLEDNIESGVKSSKDLYNKFVRLSEHINLQISQLNFYAAQRVNLISSLENIACNQNDLAVARNELITAKSEVATAKKDLVEMTQKIGEMEGKINAANNKADSLDTQVVTVLSIFAAIVLAFSGGITILGSAITALASTEIVVYKLAFICLLTGFVLFNTIFMLMYFVAKITGRSVYATCNVENCTCGKEGKAKCKDLTKIRRRLPYVYYFNLAVIILMVVDVGIWELIKNGFLP